MDIFKKRNETKKYIKANHLDDYDALASMIIDYYDWLDSMSEYVPSAKRCKEVLQFFISRKYMDFHNGRVDGEGEEVEM